MAITVKPNGGWIPQVEHLLVLLTAVAELRQIAQGGTDTALRLAEPPVLAFFGSGHVYLVLEEEEEGLQVNLAQAEQLLSEEMTTWLARAEEAAGHQLQVVVRPAPQVEAPVQGEKPSWGRLLPFRRRP